MKGNQMLQYLTNIRAVGSKNIRGRCYINGNQLLEYQKKDPNLLYIMLGPFFSNVQTPILVTYIYNTEI